MIDPDFAHRFAEEWIAAWNSHDLERVLTHYAEDFEMSSPYIRQIAGEPTGILRGKAAVVAYWARALGLIPDLRFTLRLVLVGAESVAVHYAGAGGRLAVEVFHFGADGKVVRAHAHYA
ncbi:MAG: nuclear transport factor 2 family protein [Bryobacteraceae bacterium]|nr:nuclear transport factor 2 family protein [Bryobacteraceae bacterium]